MNTETPHDLRRRSFRAPQAPDHKINPLRRTHPRVPECRLTSDDRILGTPHAQATADLEDSVAACLLS